jgi:hypothetical protein
MRPGPFTWRACIHARVPLSWAFLLHLSNERWAPSLPAELRHRKRHGRGWFRTSDLSRVKPEGARDGIG